jgi:PASTA domain
VPKKNAMGRLRTFVPRLVALTAVWLLATAALTYAASQQITATPAPTTPVTTAAAAAPTLKVVPDVRRQPFVFAKATLGDSGFSWRVQGSVQGFAANLVATQTPAAGTRLIDTGAPLIVLRLSRGSGGQSGVPEEASDTAPTAVKLADLAVGPAPARAAATATSGKPAPATTVGPKTTAPASTAAASTAAATTAKQKVTKQASHRAASHRAASHRAASPRAASHRTPSHRTPSHRTAARQTSSHRAPSHGASHGAPSHRAPSHRAPRWPQNRPPLFADPGARREPLDEMPLAVRANLLLAWLKTDPKPTDSNVRRWLYQHAWVVAGARMGWWQGDDALRTLVAADNRVWALWGIGARSQAVATATLTEVEAQSK